jgi:glyoxylate carboligase
MRAVHHLNKRVFQFHTNVIFVQKLHVGPNINLPYLHVLTNNPGDFNGKYAVYAER